MTNEYERDMQNCRAGLEEARRELLDVVSSLSDDDLDNTPRGQWPVRRIMEHVIWHEQIYVRMIAHIRGHPGPGEMPDYTPSSVANALQLLDESRSAVLAGIDGVDEGAFYKLGKMGYEEYSIFSMLENEANHELEHAAQIKKTLDNG